MKEQRFPTSFKLKKSVVGKLEKIRAYHQDEIQKAVIGKDLTLSKTNVVEGLIEQVYFEMVQDGQIKEE